MTLIFFVLRTLSRTCRLPPPPTPGSFPGPRPGAWGAAAAQLGPAPEPCPPRGLHLTRGLLRARHRLSRAEGPLTTRTPRAQRLPQPQSDRRAAGAGPGRRPLRGAERARRGRRGAAPAAARPAARAWRQADPPRDRAVEIFHALSRIRPGFSGHIHPPSVSSHRGEGEGRRAPEQRDLPSCPALSSPRAGPRAMAAVEECLRAVGLQFWADSLQELPALLVPAVLLGLLLGAGAAALLCRCALGPRRGGEVRGAGGEGAAGRPGRAPRRSTSD